MFGAVARDPSYLYHYLMSFPYRLITLFTHDQTIQVLWLRGLNIALFAWGLVVFRRLLLKTGASKGIVHLCLLLFVLLPVVPQLAAQINYDNLFIPLTGLALLLTISFSQELLATQRINTKLFLQIISVSLLASLVKYAFLPILAVIFLYVAALLWRTYRKAGWRKLWLGIGFGWTLMGRYTRWLLVLVVVVSAGLFTERYGLNMVHYHTPLPDCRKVLSVSQCSAYGPWIRDYDFAINRIDEEHNPLVFTGEWLYGMWLRLYFALDGPAGQFETRGPLPVPALSVLAFAVLGSGLFIVFAKRIFQRYDQSALWLFATMAGVYIATLWIDEYHAYTRTGQPVAINGRYLFPVLLPVVLLLALAYAEWLKQQTAAKLLLAGFIIMCSAWGGGALTYILRSHDSWYWNNAAVRTANHAVQQTLGPVTPGFYEQNDFLR